MQDLGLEDCDLLNCKCFAIKTGARLAIFHFSKDYYNTHRYHSSVEYYPPINYDVGHQNSRNHNS